MRKLSLATFALIPALALSACASNGARSTASTELDQLRRDCEARGGTLVPSGRLTGQTAIDNPCRLRNATALPPAS